MTRVHLSVAALTAIASLTLAAVSLTAQQKPKNVRDGAFTADQAQRGKSGYDGVCQRCHGAALPLQPRLLGGRTPRRFHQLDAASLPCNLSCSYGDSATDSGKRFGGPSSAR